MNEKITFGAVLKYIWLAVKIAIVLFAIFHSTNVSVLYQSF